MKSFKYVKNLFLVFLLFGVPGCGFSVEPAKETASGGLNALGFQVAANLETGTGMSFTPQVAVEPDGDGTAIAVWVKLEDPDTGDSDPRQVYRVFSSYHNGISWDTPQVIDSGSALYYNAWSPKVSMDDNGDAMAVWQQSDGTTERVYARRSVGGSWGAVTELNGTADFAGLSAGSPAIAVEPDGGGTAMAVWSQMTSSNGWQTIARRFSGAVWVTTDAATGCTAGGSNGLDDGICQISGGNSLTPSDSPVVAMDASGRAIAAFIRLEAWSCFDEGTADLNANTSIVTCYTTSLYTNRFNGAAWSGEVRIDPDAPLPFAPCFSNNNTGQELVGRTYSCVSAAQPRIGMDRAGNAIVVVKVYWTESEDQQNNNAVCFFVGPSNGNSLCDSSGHGGIEATGTATDEWSGNSIAAVRYTESTNTWAAATFLYAHSNQPSDSTQGGGSERFYNCPAAGRVQTETNRWLIECNLNVPQIALSGDGSGTALAVWERFDGTNYDVHADCFTVVSAATCSGAAASGWRSTFVIPALGTATNDSYTTHYLRLNDTAVSRVAFSPQVALDSTGNGLAVWTQKDATGRWRVYGMRFESGTGFDTTTRTTIDNYTAGDLYYFSPVVAMEWVNTGNAGVCPGGVNCGSAWTLFLESQLTLGGILPALNIRVRANQWTPP